MYLNAPAKKMKYLVGFFFTACFSFTGLNDPIQDHLYQPTDFTQEHIFTAGIEGPATTPGGDILAVNFKKQGTIGKISKAGKGTLYLELPTGSIGNGIRFGKDGEFFIADYTRHNILKGVWPKKSVEVFAHHPSMNQPNDIAITHSGQLFASDPNWKESTGNIWRIDPDGKVTLLEENMGTTNGIEVSPDENILYVNESVQRNVWAYRLDRKGNISQKRLFHHFDDFGMDGMRCDQKGNLFITRHGKGTVAIIDPEGNLINEVKLTGKKPSNITFGGADGRTCYVTLQDRGCIESFRTEFPGRSWKMF